MKGEGREREKREVILPWDKSPCLPGRTGAARAGENASQGSPTHGELSALGPSATPYVGQYINYVGKGAPVSPPLPPPSQCSKRQE